MTAARILLWAVTVNRVSTTARPPQGHVRHRHRRAVGEPATDGVPADHAEAEEDRQPGDRAVGEAGDVGHHRRDVGDDREGAAEAEPGHRHGEQDLDVLGGGELMTEVCAFGLRQLGDQPGDAQQPDHAERGDAGEGDAPADGLPDEGAQGDTDDMGDGQPADHHGDRTGLLLGRPARRRPPSRRPKKAPRASEATRLSVGQASGSSARHGRRMTPPCARHSTKRPRTPNWPHRSASWSR